MADSSRGFASMDESKRKEIASKGGKASSRGSSMSGSMSSKSRSAMAHRKTGQNSNLGN